MQGGNSDNSLLLLQDRLVQIFINLDCIDKDCLNKQTCIYIEDFRVINWYTGLHEQTQKSCILEDFQGYHSADSRYCMHMLKDHSQGSTTRAHIALRQVTIQSQTSQRICTQQLCCQYCQTTSGTRDQQQILTSQKCGHSWSRSVSKFSTAGMQKQSDL